MIEGDFVEAAQLLGEARQAQLRAYAPYSRYQVGAALLCGNGQVYTGANIENSSYGLTVCAERVAIFKAVFAGEKDFKSIAICGSGEGYIYPCGACLQVMAEFAPGINVIVSNEADQYKEFSLKDLLPQIFSL